MVQALSKRDKLIPWYFVAFFLFIALVDGIMVTIAVRTQTGLVTDHPYERGLAYNKVVEAERIQEQFGWKSKIDFRNGKLSFALYDREGKQLKPQSLKAHFIRPTHTGMDFDAELQYPDTAINFPAQGLWQVRIYAVVNGQEYQQSHRMVVE